MKCPACANQLTIKTVTGVNLDVCDNGCGGIWFDDYEFKKFDEQLEPDAETVLNLTVKQRASDKAAQYNCPKCLTIVMMRRFTSVKKTLTIDQCAQCAGIWLDAGELQAIRSEFPTEAEQRKAAEDLFSEMFDAKLQQLHNKSLAEVKKEESFAKSLRFICPSYYIPGKQKGGAL